MDSFVRQISVNSIMGALFPYIARQQDDRATLCRLYQRYLHIISFLAVALSGMLFLTAHFVFLIVFTAKWAYAAELFQLIAIIGFAWPVSSLMCNIIAGVGNSKAFLRLEIYKKILFLPVYIFGFILGLKGFIICFIVANCIAIVLNAFFISAEINIRVAMQLKIIAGYVLSSIPAAACARAIVYMLCFPQSLSRHFFTIFFFYHLLFTDQFLIKA